MIGAKQDMEKLKDAVTAYVERGKVCPEYRDDVMDALEAALLEDEATTRKVLAECTPEEFEDACVGVLECAQKFGLPFVEYVEKLAEEKGWTDYTRNMIRGARAAVE